MHRFLILLVLGCLALVGCGGDDDKSDDDTPKATPAPPPPAADLEPIKAYLLEHTDRLVTSVELLQRDAQEYYDLAEAVGLRLREAAQGASARRSQTAIKELQGAHIQANPAYEEMEGVVAGVPSLADYDVIIDAGADGSDPENAVPFTSRPRPGKKFKQPGNFFALIETSVFGTEPKFAGQGRRARPRRRRQGRRSPRRCRTPTSCSPRRPTSSSTRRSSTSRPRSGTRRSRTRSPPWS